MARSVDEFVEETRTRKGGSYSSVYNTRTKQGTIVEHVFRDFFVDLLRLITNPFSFRVMLIRRRLNIPVVIWWFPSQPVASAIDRGFQKMHILRWWIHKGKLWGRDYLVRLEIPSDCSLSEPLYHWVITVNALRKLKVVCLAEHSGDMTDFFFENVVFIQLQNFPPTEDLLDKISAKFKS